MIVELTQLASKKLAEARGRALTNIKNWQAAAEAVALANEQVNDRIAPPELTSELSTAPERAKSGDYLTVLKIEEEAVAARGKLFACATSVLDRAEATAQRLADQAQSELRNLVLPPSPDLAKVTVAGVLAALAGFVVGVFLIATRGVFTQKELLNVFGCGCFPVPFVFAYVFAIAAQWISWMLRCCNLKIAACSMAARKTATAEAARHKF